MQNFNTKIYRIFIVLGISVLGCIILAYDISAVYTYNTNIAFPHFPIDPIWFLFFCVLLIIVGVLLLFRQERLLITLFFLFWALFLLIAGIAGKLIETLLVWIFILISTTLFGRFLIKRLGTFGQNQPIVEKILLYIGIGFIATSIFIAVIGHLKLLYPAFAWGWLLLTSLVSAYSYLKDHISLRNMLIIPVKNWPVSDPVANEILGSLPNIHFIDTVPYDILPAYIKHFDVGIIPFKINKVTHAVRPLKALEYLSLKIPVVSTPMKEIETWPSVLTASTAQEFAYKIDFALANRSTLSETEEVLRLLKESDWSKVIQPLLDKISDCLK